jgi:hypothetical protein
MMYRITGHLDDPTLGGRFAVLTQDDEPKEMHARTCEIVAHRLGVTPEHAAKHVRIDKASLVEA